MPEEEVKKPEELGIPIPGEQIPKAVEDAARSLGWTPFEEFRGPDEEWVDPVVFLVRQGQLTRQSSQNNKRLNKINEELRATLNSLKVHNETVYKGEVKRLQQQIKELEAEKQEALKENNAALVEDINTKISDIKESMPPPPVIPDSTENDVVLTDWYEKNPWYNTHPEMKRFADAIGDEWATKKLPLPKILDKIEKAVLAEWPEFFGRQTRAKPDAVESAGKRTTGDKKDGTNGGKKYNWSQMSPSQQTIAKQFERHGAKTAQEYMKELDEMGILGVSHE